jgi:hypothetical protein
VKLERRAVAPVYQLAKLRYPTDQSCVRGLDLGTLELAFDGEQQRADRDREQAGDEQREPSLERGPAAPRSVRGTRRRRDGTRLNISHRAA